MKITGADLVALVSIPCFSLLIYMGHNGAITTLLATIVGWYYGRRKNAETAD